MFERFFKKSKEKKETGKIPVWVCKTKNGDLKLFTDKPYPTGNNWVSHSYKAECYLPEEVADASVFKKLNYDDVKPLQMWLTF